MVAGLVDVLPRQAIHFVMETTRPAFEIKVPISDVACLALAAGLAFRTLRMEPAIRWQFLNDVFLKMLVVFSGILSKAEVAAMVGYVKTF